MSGGLRRLGMSGGLRRLGLLVAVALIVGVCVGYYFIFYSELQDQKQGLRNEKKRLDRDLEIGAVVLDVDDELRLFRFPLRAEALVLHPQAIKGAAGAGPVGIDAAAGTGYEVGAPFVLGLFQLRNAQNLAAQRAVAAASSRHERDQLVFVLIYFALCPVGAFFTSKAAGTDASNDTSVGADMFGS